MDSWFKLRKKIAYSKNIGYYTHSKVNFTSGTIHVQYWCTEYFIVMIEIKKEDSVLKIKSTAYDTY